MPELAGLAALVTGGVGGTCAARELSSCGACVAVLDPDPTGVADRVRAIRGNLTKAGREEGRREMETRTKEHLMRTALVTGGASGLGKACARKLGEDGLRVVTADLAPGADIRLDVTDEDAVLAAAAAVGPVDIPWLTRPASSAPTSLSSIPGRRTGSTSCA
jgi:hypothetical protein